MDSGGLTQRKRAVVNHATSPNGTADPRSPGSLQENGGKPGFHGDLFQGIIGIP